MDIPGCVRLRWGMRDEQLEKLISSYGEEAEPLGITSQRAQGQPESVLAMNEDLTELYNRVTELYILT
jgi:hypothetical protein